MEELNFIHFEEDAGENILTLSCSVGKYQDRDKLLLCFGKDGSYHNISADLTHKQLKELGQWLIEQAERE